MKLVTYLRPTERLRGGHPLDLDAWLGPPADRKCRVEVNEARVRSAPEFPHPDRVRRGGTPGPERAAYRRGPTSAVHRRRPIHVHVAEARRRAVERRVEEGVGAVQVHDGVAAGDVEGQGVVELHALGPQVRRHAAAGHERCWPDDEPPGGRADGDDRVGVVEGREGE